MAVGLALMMGFRFIENFNFPSISQSITEVWRRWHISLSTWLRDYLYIPLGGNRKGVARTYINLFLTMLLGGLWHGANWTFILWGAWHGGLLAAERYKAEILPPKKNAPAFRVLNSVYCVMAVLIGWVLFRAVHIDSAVTFYKAMMGLSGTGLSDAFRWQVKGIALTALAAGLVLIVVQPMLSKYRSPVELSKGSNAVRTEPPLYMQVAIAALFLLAASRLIAMSYSPFLYFQF
jgi:alginate O-acetyltransferase complex protein AlgI